MSIFASPSTPRKLTGLPPGTFGSFPFSDPFSPDKHQRDALTASIPHSISISHRETNQETIEHQFLEASQGGNKANLPWLEADVVEQRCRKFGLDHDRALSFTRKCEFVSLGCFCGVTRALQCLGLKRFSYPFDWVRSDVPSTIRCFEDEFESFCTSDYIGHSPSPGVLCHGDAKWGGSFWHHDPEKLKVKSDFQRRIERLKGNSEVPPDKARVFCVALNALSDLAFIPTLRTHLEELLPRADVYLVVFIDNQPAVGPVLVETDDDRTFFYWVYQDMFEDNGKVWSEQKHAEAYADGLASAIRLWAGTESIDCVPEVESYAYLYERCSNFNGGNPARSLYWPVRVAREQTPNIASNKHKESVLCVPSMPWPLSLFLRPCSNIVGEDEICEVANNPTRITAW